MWGLNNHQDFFAVEEIPTGIRDHWLFKYYVSKEVGGWVWPNADVSWQGLNSNLMITDLPHKKIGPIKTFFVASWRCSVSVLLAVSVYCEESLVSSNLNSKLFRFHCVRPNVGGWVWGNADVMFEVGMKKCWRLLIKWVGGSKKGQKHADIILEWSLISLVQGF